MRPSSRAEAAMMVREIAGHDAVYVFERLSLVESLHYQALWWQKNRCVTLLPGSQAIDFVL